MMATEIRAVRTKVPDGEHLEYLLEQAQAAVDNGEAQLAVTHLAQAAFVGATKGTRLTELELLRRVKNVIDAGGRVA